MADVYVKFNDEAFREMAIGPELRAAVSQVVENKGRPIAEGLAAEISKTGDYESHFNTRTAIVPLKTSYGIHDVVAGILENDSEHAAAVEWGNSNDRKPHRILGRTAAALRD